MMDAQHAGLPIVVGVDGSDRALKAVRWAAVEAVQRNVQLHVVTAFAAAQNRSLSGTGLGDDQHEVMLDEARRQLAEAVAVAEETDGVRASQELTVGFPVPVLLEASERAQLVVLGDRGHGGVSGLLVGSVATAMASRAACPVVLVRNDDLPADDRTRPVVVGVDGSPMSEGALAFGFAVASERGVPLVVVHAWQDLYIDSLTGAALDWDAIETEEHEVLAERLAGWGQKYPDVPVQRRVVWEGPAPTLIAESEGAQLVVVGSRGRGAAMSLLLGSVSHALLHRARCSVAVVRSGSDDEH